MIIPCKGYRVEGRNIFGTQAQDYPSTIDDHPKDYNESIVEYMDHEAYWYRNYFMGRDYTTFIGYVDDDEPLLLSAICETLEDGVQKQYRLIIRTKQVLFFCYYLYSVSNLLLGGGSRREEKKKKGFIFINVNIPFFFFLFPLLFLTKA